jgi:hypothetical protein
MDALTMSSITEGPLARRIQGAAHNVARRYAADPNDVEQDMRLVLFQLYTSDPDAYAAMSEQALVNYAANRAGYTAREELRHEKYFAEDAPISDAPNAPTLIDTLGTNEWPAVELALDLNATLGQLSERDRRIALDLRDGYTVSEAAAHAGLSRTSLYNYHINNHIAPALAAAL